MPRKPHTPGFCILPRIAGEHWPTLTDLEKAVYVALAFNRRQAARGVDREKLCEWAGIRKPDNVSTATVGLKSKGLLSTMRPGGGSLHYTLLDPASDEYQGETAGLGASAEMTDTPPKGASPTDTPRKGVSPLTDTPRKGATDTPRKGASRHKSTVQDNVLPDPTDSQTSEKERNEPPELKGLRLFENDAALLTGWGERLRGWERAYPLVDIPAKIAVLHAWRLDHPEKPYKSEPGFIGGCLGREQRELAAQQPRDTYGDDWTEADWQYVAEIERLPAVVALVDAQRAAAKDAPNTPERAPTKPEDVDDESK